MIYAGSETEEFCFDINNFTDSDSVTDDDESVVDLNWPTTK